MLKNYLLPVLAFLLMANNQASAQKFETAIEYAQFFNQEFAYMQYLQMQYTSLVVHADPEIADQISTELDVLVDGMLKKFEGVEEYSDDQGLRKSAVNVLETMKQTSENDLNQEIMNEVGCVDCFVAEELRYELLNRDSELVGAAMDDMNEKLTAFAEANGIEMTESDDDGDYTVEVISRVTDYIQLLDLVVLEMQYAEDEVINRLNEQDIEGAKDANKELGKAINNAQKRMNKIDQIKEDRTMWGQTERLIEFYKDANKTYFPEMLSAFDKDGQIINDKVDVYNDNIELMNTGKADKFNRFYQAKDNLLKRVVPKPDETATGDRT